MDKVELDKQLNNLANIATITIPHQTKTIICI